MFSIVMMKKTASQFDTIQLHFVILVKNYRNKQKQTRKKQTQKQDLRYSVKAEICKTRRKHEIHSKGRI